MSSLSVDIGNTKIKAGIFTDDLPEQIIVFDHTQLIQLQHIIEKYRPGKSILCQVGNPAPEIEQLLDQQTDLLRLSSHTPLPFENKYSTPETLGMDRVAAVVGALHHFPGNACLVIDIGTCITYDFITPVKAYLGGAISPGLEMRLNAMHHFTRKLPALSFRQVDDFVGTSTETAMLSGVYYGILGEINESILRYEERYGQVQVLTCGGNAALFDKHIKSNIFAAPFLVLHGLNQILKFNVQ